MTDPILPDSPVPRAKMTVMALQAALLVTSLAVLEPLPVPPQNWGDLLFNGSELGKAAALAASANRSVPKKSILIRDLELRRRSQRDEEDLVIEKTV